MNAIRKRVTKAQGKPGYRAKVRVKGHARVQGAGLFAQQFIANGGVVDDPGPQTRDSLRDYFIDVQQRRIASRTRASSPTSPGRRCRRTRSWSPDLGARATSSPRE